MKLDSNEKLKRRKSKTYKGNRGIGQREREKSDLGDNGKESKGKRERDKEAINECEKDGFFRWGNEILEFFNGKKRLLNK